MTIVVVNFQMAVLHGCLPRDIQGAWTPGGDRLHPGSHKGRLSGTFAGKTFMGLCAAGMATVCE